MPSTICPFAAQHILHGEEDRRPTFTPIATALHVAVTTASGSSLGRYFDDEKRKTDSTFYVDMIGGLWQFGPVNRVANAQFNGNRYAVSIETGGVPTQALNPAQVSTLIRLYQWLFTEWGIPLEPSAGWNKPGAGWHNKYREWNQNAHACPGPIRVGQLLDVILPSARGELSSASTHVPTTSQEDDMPTKIVVPVPWAKSAPGAEAHWIIFEQEKPTEVSVCSVNGAPFTPPWKDGAKTKDYEDVVFLGLWWRRFTHTAGRPTGALAYADRVVFTCEGTPGTYTIANK